MAFSKAALLTGVCLFSISGFVQESDARDVELRSGRGLAELEFHSDVSGADTDDGNEGNEGDEGNEGSFEGDEGGDQGPLQGDTSFEVNGGGLEVPGTDDGGDDGGDDMGGEDMPPPEEMPEDMPEDMPPPEDMPDEMPPPEEMPEDMPEEEMPEEEMPPAEEMPEDMPEEMPAEEEEAPEEDGDGTAGVAAAGGAAAAGAAAAGAAAAGAGEEDEAVAPVVVPGDVADTPIAVAPSPDGVIPPVCTDLRQAIKDASPALAPLIDQIAPIGDTNDLSVALDNEDLSVTVLLPEDEVLAQYAGLLAAPEASDITTETVQQVLLTHILPEALESGELLELGDGMVETVLDDVVLDMMVDGQIISFMYGNDTAIVTEADLPGCASSADGESVIHRIDNIFLPDDIVPPPTGAPPVVDDREIPEDLLPEEDSASVMSVLTPAAASAVAAIMLFL